MHPISFVKSQIDEISSLCMNYEDIFLRNRLKTVGVIFAYILKEKKLHRRKTDFE